MTASAVSDAKHPSPAIQGCLEACRRCRALVDAVIGRGDELERAVLRAIGPHLRHCIEHFQCFFSGCESGVVDYEARERDERLERDPAHFLAELAAATARLRSLDPSTARTMAVRQEAAPGGQVRTVDTNVERELLFLSSHTIHHLAIMTLLAERAGVEVPEKLGVAFSTASWEERSGVHSGA